MKQGWTYKKLGEVCDFRSGFAFKSSKFTKNGEPIIRISDIQNEEIDESNLVYFDPKSYKEDLSKYIIYPDDILIAMSGGTTGKLGLNKSNRTFYLNQRVGVFRENKQYINHRYLFYYLHTKSEESLRIAAGAAQPNLSTAQIKDFVIPIPPLSEQQRIVSRLDSAFAHIDELKANAEKQVNDARALFQKALSKAMEPKEGWEEKTLGEITKITHGKNQKEVLAENGQYPIYGSGGNIMGYANDYLCEANTTILGRKGSINNPQYITERFWNVDTAFGISAKEGYENKFVYYFIKSVNWSEKNTGTTLPSLTQQVVGSVQLFVPLLSEQQRIVERLDSLSENVKALEENQRKVMAECDALKQALLRKVFE